MANFDKEQIAGLVRTARVTTDLSWYKRNTLPQILAGKARYKAVAKVIGCPLALVPLIHLRENAYDLGKFKSYLGNGEPFNRVTTLVPKGRGPFLNWEAGAIDALKYDGIDKITDWGIERMLYELESYNGFGYRGRGINSPYVWGLTNHYSKGYYIADGQYDRNAESKNIGCYAAYLMLCEADPEFKIDQTPIESTPGAPQEDGWLVKFITALVDFITKYFSETQESPVAQEPKPATTTRNKEFLLACAQEIGVKEVAGSGNSADVVRYHRAANAANNNSQPDSTAWCASFICWALESVGMGSTNSMMARSYENWGVSTKADPLPGDIVVFYRNGMSSGSGHVGCLIKKQGSNVFVLGGNQDDQVNITRYSTARMTDIRRSSKAGQYSAEQMADLYATAEDILAGREVSEPGSVV